MLQQTRVEAVIPYYHRFLDRFPNVESLAAAPEQDVLTAWSGLGYYSRARNLQQAAKQIAAASMPSSWEAIRELRGVGDYTAAAIGSIALGLPHAAVDGNVLRVISRLTNDAGEITAPATRRRIAEYAHRRLDRRRPGDFNQAMMELGATICTPTTPSCSACPVSGLCKARELGTQNELPVKLKKQTVREVKLDLALIEHDGHVLLLKRHSSEKRLADFWELPGKKSLPRMKTKRLAQFRHQIVNDRITVTVWRIPFRPADSLTIPAGEWISAARLSSLPLTTVTKKALAIVPLTRL